MSKPSPEKVPFWPGSSIAKSTGNAFTSKGPSMFATPAEAVKAAKHVKAEQARKTAKATCEAFGGNQLDLSKPRRVKRAA